MNEVEGVIIGVLLAIVVLVAMYRWWRPPAKPEPTLLQTLNQLNGEAIMQHLDACAELEVAQHRAEMLHERMVRLQSHIDRITKETSE